MKVSIITVCFNSASTIRDAISSVISQSYPEIEYICIDGKTQACKIESIPSVGLVTGKPLRRSLNTSSCS